MTTPEAMHEGGYLKRFHSNNALVLNPQVATASFPFLFRLGTGGFASGYGVSLAEVSGPELSFV